MKSDDARERNKSSPAGLGNKASYDAGFKPAVIEEPMAFSFANVVSYSYLRI